MREKFEEKRERGTLEREPHEKKKKEKEVVVEFFTGITNHP